MANVTSAQVKKLAANLGADLCGIASIERFANAPAGFRPDDIDAGARSVIAFAKRLPTGSISSRSCVPYTHANTLAVMETDCLTYALALALEDLGLRTVIIPTDDPYEHWEADRSRGQAILSLRHAGWLAGLGTMGKNTLLANERYGNMIQIGAVLVDAPLEEDPMVQTPLCPPDCRRCLKACPVAALDGTTVDQQRCRPLSNFLHEKGYRLKKCNRCRAVCPNSLGKRN